MTDLFVNIHTHHPTSRGIELRTAGIHPWDADKLRPTVPEEGPDDVQAIGEIGLDRVHGPEFGRQLEVFRAQLAQACLRGLPVVIHCVRAFGEVMHELAIQPPRAVIFHGFIGSPEQAQQALDKGYYLSFGERTFASPRTLEALRKTPIKQLFVETDESTEPIEDIYTRVAEARGIGLETLQQAVLENYEHIFTHE